MKTLISYILLIILIGLVFALNAFIALSIISMVIVPLTYLYSLIIGKSYNFVIDQSNILFKINKIGQWSLLICGSFLIVRYICPNIIKSISDLLFK